MAKTIHRKRLLAFTTCFTVMVGQSTMASETSAQTFPPSRIENVVETLHGVKVSDPYRWLENGDDPAVNTWTAAQNAYSRSYLDRIAGREKLEKRLWALHEIGAVGIPTPRGQGKVRSYFHVRRSGKQNQGVLFVRKGLTGKDTVLVDVNGLRADGTASLDWWTPSDDGKLLAYGVSLDGSEEATLRVRTVATGKDLPDVIERARHTSLVWRPDGKGFFYARYPKAGEVPAGDENYFRKIYFHSLGSDPATDLLIFGDGRDKTDWPGVDASPDGRWLLIQIEQGWSKTEVYLADLKTWSPLKKTAPAFVPVAVGRNAIFSVASVTNDRVFLMTNEGAPRYQLVTFEPAHPGNGRDQAAWKSVLRESKDTLESVVFLGGGRHFAARYLVDASARVQLFELNNKTAAAVPRAELPLPALGTVDGFGGQLTGDELFFRYYSFLQPSTVFRHDLRTGKTETWAQLNVPIAAGDFDVKQVKYPSKDGTLVPMFLVAKKGLAHDGNNPTLLYGYGGFNSAMTPAFASRVAPFIEAGGVYAVANLRGGSEYGEDWHRAGMLAQKQNVFDDFIAAAEYLIREKITSPARLAASGRSNGGLLAGAALTQRPELFAAIISGVPLLDMVRYHRFRIAKLWIPEYGDPEKPDDFRWLLAYSPYHRVKDGARYPATYIFTAESDTRVDPMHARKMTARLQAASVGGGPFLLWLESQAGHGAGKPLGKIVAQYTDELAFLFSALKMPLPL